MHILQQRKYLKLYTLAGIRTVFEPLAIEAEAMTTSPRH
jgi:hypothetical protein